MEKLSEARQWWLMVPLMIGVFLSPLNVVFTGIALPTMRTDFGITIERATWIATAYFIPSVALMPLQGYLGERWGVRRTYAIGLLILSAGGLGAALASSLNQLFLARIVQGIGWSALYPLALVLIRTHFPRGRQGAMMGLWESAVGLATIVAPLVGGVAVERFGWRALYVILGTIAFLAAFATISAIPPRDPAVAASSDWFGGLQLTAVLLLFLVSVVRRDALLFVVAWLVGLWWFLRARGHPDPFARPALFANRRFSAASLAAHVRVLVAISAVTALPLFFEEVQGVTPSRVGTIMTVYSIFLFLSAWPGGRWSDRAGARVPGAIGYVAMIAGVLLLLGLDSQWSVGLAAAALAIRGVGAGLSQAPYAKAAVDAVDDSQRKVASGLYGTVRYSGLALGTALVGIFLQSRLAYYGAPDGGPAAVAAYRELWLLLSAAALLGLIATVMMGRPVPEGPAATAA